MPSFLRVLAVTLVAAGMLGAAPARAGEAGIVGGWLVFTAYPGEANDISVDVAPNPDPDAEGPLIAVTDAVAIEAGPGCTGGPVTVVCDAHPIRLELSDGDDAVSCASASACFGMRVFGGEGSDTIIGSEQMRVFGGPGDDTIVGGEGLTAFGEDGHDEIVAHAAWSAEAPARAYGGAGNDEIVGTGESEAYGGKGADRLEAQHAVGGSGPDSLVGRADDDCLVGGDGADQLTGGRGYDRLFGGPGDDELSGGVGSDDLIGGLGADRISGDDGRNDTAYYRGSSRPVRVTLDGRPNDGARGERDNIRASVEGIVGSRKADVLVGNALRNVLFGDSGDDVIRGGGGNDFLAGESGADDLAGGAGNDVLRGASFTFRDDFMPDGSRPDRLRGGAGADSLASRDFGPDALVDGGPGRDRAAVDRGVDPLSAIERALYDPWSLPWRHLEPQDAPYVWPCGTG